MYIYKTSNNINGKIYIGLSTRLIEESMDYLGSGPKLHSAIRKYGIENFTKEILEDNISTNKELGEREIYWISYYNSTDSLIGYNILTGGYGGNGHYERTPEMRLAASIKSKETYQPAKTPEAMERIRQGTIKRNKMAKGKKLSESHRASIGIAASIAMKGYKYKTVECPHCGKSGSGGNMTRYHFSNCKNLK